jgi:hypothetical protein
MCWMAVGKQQQQQVARIQVPVSVWYQRDGIREMERWRRIVGNERGDLAHKPMDSHVLVNWGTSSLRSR